MMRCATCEFIEYIDVGKKKKVRNCTLGLTATSKFLHYCGGYANSRQ